MNIENTKFDELIKLVVEKYKKEYGQEATMDEGEHYFCVFNDGIIVLSLKDTNLETNIIYGKPEFIDFTLNESGN